MKLTWGSGSGPCMKVIMVMEEVGKWNGGQGSKLIEFSKKEHKTEENLKLNPRGQVPVLEDDDGTVVNESGAACMYLDQKYNKGALMLAGTKDYAGVLQRVFEISNISSNIERPLMYYKMMTKKEDLDQALLKTKVADADKELSLWNSYLDGKDFLVGGKFSMADLFLYVHLLTLDRQGVDLKSLYPNLSKFMKAQKSRPSAVAAIPPHWSSGPGPRLMEDFKPERA